MIINTIIITTIIIVITDKYIYIYIYIYVWAAWSPVMRHSRPSAILFGLTLGTVLPWAPEKEC